MKTKLCTKCGEMKGLEEFSPGKGYKDGLRGDCKKCHSAYVAASYKTEIGRQNINEYRRYRRRAAQDASP